jgi:protein-disulfide isomerase
MRFLLVFLPVLMITAQAQTPVKNFKESGSPNAPIALELYTDYECPHCREFFLDVLPDLNKEFIATGKVRLVHRDFRIPSHQFSKIATSYANAAGEIGKFDVVTGQLFQTQPEWSQNGNVDGAVAKVLSPADMEKVRTLVKTDPHLDDSTARDEAMAMNQDHLTVTPTIVIVAKGKREVINGGMSYPILKAYLNQKLAQ